MAASIMDAAEDWLRARGIEKLQLMVRPDNSEVQAFYQSLGYFEPGAHRLRQMARRPRADTVADEISRYVMTVSDRIRVQNVRVLSDNSLH